jgi:aldehyde reductase
MEDLLQGSGKLRSIGLSDVSLEKYGKCSNRRPLNRRWSRLNGIPTSPITGLLEFCNQNGIVMLAFAPPGHGMKPGVLEDPVITAIARRVNQTPAQVLLARAVQRGTAVLTTARTPARAKENFNISALPEDVMDQITAIQTPQRLNPVTATGIPGFIARSK